MYHTNGCGEEKCGTERGVFRCGYSSEVDFQIRAFVCEWAFECGYLEVWIFGCGFSDVGGVECGGRRDGGKQV